MASPPDIWVIVPAAGVGARMQAAVPKQYLPLLGRPVILHTLQRLCSYAPVRGVLVGVAPEDAYWPQLPTETLGKLAGTFIGGAVRAKTVLNGLVALADHARADDWVMVHDAVRPCVRHTDLDKLVAACNASSHGALLAAPVTDTVKRADASGAVLETVARAGLWRALTPQMFRLKQLRDALASAETDGVEMTDESAAIERRGGRPRVVEGASDNIKITRPADLAAAELFLTQQAAEQS
ncbi:MAG: 2-C-methyl-D-erythritol 4-phosphate cytidylyltransferase [Sulfurifustis sp.]